MRDTYAFFNVTKASIYQRVHRVSVFRKHQIEICCEEFFENFTSQKSPFHLEMERRRVIGFVKNATVMRGAAINEAPSGFSVIFLGSRMSPQVMRPYLEMHVLPELLDAGTSGRVRNPEKLLIPVEILGLKVCPYPLGQRFRHESVLLFTP